MIYIYSTFTVHYITLHCIHTYQPKSIKFQKQKSWFFIAEAFCGLIRWEDLKVRSTEEYLCPFGLIRCHFFRGRRQGRQPLNVCMYVCISLSPRRHLQEYVCICMDLYIHLSIYLHCHFDFFESTSARSAFTFMSRTLHAHKSNLRPGGYES